MALTEWWHQVMVAVLGGAAAETLHWWALARRGRPVARYRKQALYWSTTVVMVAFGGIMPLLYISGDASALLCFHLGAATPILLQQLIKQAPNLTTGQGPSGQSDFREFIDW